MSLLSSSARSLERLIRAPGAATAIASLAIGIGATSAVLTLAAALLLSGAPGVSEPRQLAGIYTATAPDRPLGGTSYPNFLDLRENQQAFKGLAAYYRTSISWAQGAEAEPVEAEAVSGGYFSVLGVTPAKGRLLGPEDDRATAEPVAVVSYTFWNQRLRQNRDFETMGFVLNGTRFAIVGVAAPGFRGPSLLGATEVWIPLATLSRVASGPMSKEILQDRGAQWFSMVGRLGPAHSVSQAQAELEAIRSRLERAHGTAAWGRPITVTDWQEVALGRDQERSRRLLDLLTICSTVILLAACANAAHLLIGRAFVRRSEVALRLVLGATRGRAAFSVAGECLLLGLSAYAGGLAVRQIFLRLLLQLGFPLTELDVRLTLASAFGALAITLATFFLFGSAPWLILSRTGLLEATKGGGLVIAEGKRFRPGKALVVLEASFATILLIASFLIVASTLKVMSIDPGFDASKVAIALVDLSGNQVTPDEAMLFYEQLLERVRSEPGVSGASLVSLLPFDGSLSWTVFVPGKDLGDATPQFGLDVVDLGSFQALGIPLLRGRDFAAGDAQEGAVIVNAALARQLWPGEEALGQTLSLEEGESQPLKVVGVVGDARYASLTEPPAPHFYLYRSFQDRTGLTTAFSSSLFLVVRTQSDPHVILPRIRRIVRDINPQLPIPRLGTLQEHLENLTVRSRYTAVLLGLLASIGLLLTAGGVYSVMLSNLSARRREIAMRMAVGATPAKIVRMAIREAILLTFGGILAGSAAAFGLTHLLETQLYEVSSKEPLAFLSAAAVLLAASWAGSLGPARKAARQNIALLLKALGTG